MVARKRFEGWQEKWRLKGDCWVSAEDENREKMRVNIHPTNNSTTTKATTVEERNFLPHKSYPAASTAEGKEQNRRQKCDNFLKWTLILCSFFPIFLLCFTIFFLNLLKQEQSIIKSMSFHGISARLSLVIADISAAHRCAVNDMTSKTRQKCEDAEGAGDADRSTQ